MKIYKDLFDLFPNAKSIALAGIYGVKPDFQDTFQLSKYISIMKRRDEFDNLYHPRMSNHEIKPEYYLIAVTDDNRYGMGFKKMESTDDVLSSISIAHQVLTIFHCVSYKLGQIEGFLLNSMGSYGLSNPQIAARNTEFAIFKQDTMFHPFAYSINSNIRYDSNLTDFYEKVAEAYINTKENRWTLSAMKYTSGMTQTYAEDAVLDLAVALESLLALDKEQISFKLRLYLSLLTGDSFTDRKQVYNDMKSFYTIRSNLVHGNPYKITDDKIKLISRVGGYLSKALIKTCGQKIKEQVLQELEFMSLLGAPRYVKEKTQTIISEDEIVDLICKSNGIPRYKSYKAYLSKDDDPDYDYTELVLTFTFEDESSNSFSASHYISQSNSLLNKNSFQYWLSKDDDGSYFYNVVHS